MNDVDLFGHAITAPAVKDRAWRQLKIRPFPSRELTLAASVGFTVRDNRDVIVAFIRPVDGQFEVWVGSNLLGTHASLAEAENAAGLAVSALGSKPKGSRS